LYELSAALDDLYINLGGPDEIVAGGYNRVLKKVSDVVGMDRIQLNCAIQEIRYDASGDATVPAKTAGAKTEEKKDDGDEEKEIVYTPPSITIRATDITDKDAPNPTTISADCCVCTVPLGVLQKRKIAFQPDLDEAHWKSIDRIGMGLLDKVMMVFETNFWKQYDHIGVVHDDPNKVQNFFDCSTDYNGKSVLGLILGGDAARRFDSPDGISDEQVILEALVTLRNIFGQDVVPDPIDFKVTRWNIDPYAYGAYSFAKVGSRARDYDRVAAPCGNLFFAGEHTSKHHHSTVHGAWHTGKREAERIIKLFGKSKK